MEIIEKIICIYFNKFWYLSCYVYICILIDLRDKFLVEYMYFSGRVGNFRIFIGLFLVFSKKWVFEEKYYF